MLDGAAGNAIEDDPRGRGAKEGCDPIPKFARKSSPLEEIKQVFPLNGVEGLPNIKLEEECGHFAFVKTPGEISNIHEVVMDTSPFNESTLGVGHEVIHVGRKS